jgi:hypothetical protein
MILSVLLKPVKGSVGNAKVGGFTKVAYDRYSSRTVVIDVHFYFYLAAILDLNLFPFPLTPA